MTIKSPFSLVLVGQQGSGKTTTIKNILKNYSKEKIFIFDPNNEYKDFNQITNLDSLFFKLEKSKGCFFILEESTSVLLNTKKQKNIIDALVRIRHTQNSILFVFHSIRSIPVFIFDFVDYGFFFKTNDRPELIEKKYKGVFSLKDIEKIKNQQKFNFIKINFNAR